MVLIDEAFSSINLFKEPESTICFVASAARFVVNKVSAAVALVSSAVILEVLEAIKVGKVAMVAELTPPTVFTIGASAVPPKSPANCNFPF